jgi:hypothetical protein
MLQFLLADILCLPMTYIAYNVQTAMRLVLLLRTKNLPILSRRLQNEYGVATRLICICPKLYIAMRERLASTRTLSRAISTKSATQLLLHYV